MAELVKVGGVGLINRSDSEGVRRAADGGPPARRRLLGVATTPPLIGGAAAGDGVKQWGQLPFAAGSVMEKVDRNVRLTTSGPLLRAIQQSGFYEDCKTFVDMPMLHDPEEVLEDFAKLPAEPSNRDLEEFIERNFEPAGVDLVHAEPIDFSADPEFVKRIASPELREFAYYIHSIWPQLFRRVDPAVEMYQQRHTLLALPYPVVVPGGRFRESYYWDSYWIVEGLLVSGMLMSARGVIKNLLHYIEGFGFVPNGGRCTHGPLAAADALGDGAMYYHGRRGAPPPGPPPPRPRVRLLDVRIARPPRPRRHAHRRRGHRARPQRLHVARGAAAARVVPRGPRAHREPVGRGGGGAVAQHPRRR